jgi:hypothetical protein
MDCHQGSRSAGPILSEAAVRSAIAKAIDFLKDTREPHALAFMTILHRRCGIAQFADCGKRYDEVLPNHSDRVLRVFRRMFDADNPIDPDDWKHVVVPTDRLMISALYCDRLGLPPTYAEALAVAVRRGGYAATHALLSWVYVQDNGCELVLPDGFEEEMYGAVAAIIDEDPTVIHDINLEAAAFLCLARQGARVDRGFVWRVVALQNDDGGWGAVGESNWHATVLGLMILAHVRFPNASEPAP